ncbi:MAG: DEAD/DEAH box helicase [Deltaproteobacteria bacterium]|nr:DEAD/DEAH box helicase [Deltaproteobacteria bacterium]
MTVSASQPLPYTEAFGTERYVAALNESREWLLRAVVAEFTSGDVGAGPLNEAEAAKLVDALAVAEITALEELENYAGTASGAPSEVLRRAAGDAFYLSRVLQRHDGSLTALLYAVKLACFAVLGDRSADARRWLREHPWQNEIPADATWAERVFRTVADAFLRVVRKDGWQDLKAVAHAIAELRTLQEGREAEYLRSRHDGGRAAAFELIALYHLAKAVEVAGTYFAKGTPKDVLDELTLHFHAAIRTAAAAPLVELEILVRWLFAATVQLAQNSVWWLLRSFNHKISEHVRNLTSETNARPLFELLPPQRHALLRDGLLNPAHRAVLVQMPTSSGKTLLAEFRILQALNSHERCWIAYLAPTRALVNQIALRLRRDLVPLGYAVEVAAPALEVDVFEAEMLQHMDAVHVLVTTPEKLDLLLRSRADQVLNPPLALVVVDEAHNLGDGERGLRCELLLSTLNRESPDTQFLLLTPFVPNAAEVASWLDDQRSKPILVADWQPNDFAIGYAYPEGRARNWGLTFRTLHTSRPGIEVDDELALGRPDRGADLARSKLDMRSIPAAITAVLSRRGTTILLAYSPNKVWETAQRLAAMLPEIDQREVAGPSLGPGDGLGDGSGFGYGDGNGDGRGDGGGPDSTPLAPRSYAADADVALVQRFLEAELGEEFALRALLNHGVGVHHSGLSPEARFLMEWLAERGKLRALVATTSLAQGVNFPVTSVVLATYKLPQRFGGPRDMPSSSFWNIAGRAGRLLQDTLGLVVFASDEAEAPQIQAFVAQQVEELVSELERMVEEVLARGDDLDLSVLVRNDIKWSGFVQYISHAYRTINQHDRFVAETEKLLRSTLGYRRLLRRRPKVAERLVDATRAYAEGLRGRQGIPALVDATGFSPESVAQLLRSRDRISQDAAAWTPDALFGGNAVGLGRLLGVLLPVRELQFDIPSGGGEGQLSRILAAWVRGAPLQQIAQDFFRTDEEGETATDRVTECCRRLFGVLLHSSSWGVAAAQALAGVPLDALPPERVEQFRSLSAMMFYGVDTVPAVLMRSLAVPRSVAGKLGERFVREAPGAPTSPRLARARTWLAALPPDAWDAARPVRSPLSGNDYHRLWRVLSGGEA